MTAAGDENVDVNDKPAVGVLPHTVCINACFPRKLPIHVF